MIKPKATITTNIAEDIILDRNSGTSLSDQIELQLKTLIIADELPSGTKLPSASEFAKEMGVAYKTMESALAVLGRAGYLKRIKNKGTFVLGKKRPSGKKCGTAKIKLKDYRIRILLPGELIHFDPKNPPLAWYNFIDITNGILEGASQMGLIAEHLYVSENNYDLESIYRDNSAVFLFSHTGYNARILREIRSRNIPYIVHAPMNGVEDDVNCIIVNVKKGAFDATGTLLKAGHKDIAFIYREIDTDPWFMPKLEGFKAALEANHIDFSDDMVIRAGFADGEACRATAEYLKTHRPQAIFASRDQYAYEAMDAVKAAGLSIPRDVAVIGFDDIPQSASPDKNLSAVRFPRKEIGLQAAKMLAMLIEHPELQPLVKILDTDFVNRETF